MSNEKKPESFADPAVSQHNIDYVESLYKQWKEDRASVGESWNHFFMGFELGLPMTNGLGRAEGEEASAQSKVSSLIFAYRNLGHLVANVNPLEKPPVSHPDLEITRFGLQEEDLEKSFDTGHLHVRDRMTLREIIEMLRETYCGSIGVQYTHIQNVNVRRWLQAEMEPRRNRPGFDAEKKMEILTHLRDAELFEAFIQTRYPGQKRFSLEGGETLIPAVHAVVEMAPEVGVEDIVVGMAHRGRLNILANILDKSYANIFSEFEGTLLPDAFGGDGDVKYHKGFSSEHRNRFGRSVHLSLTANPSHLEAVNPVVLGKVRAKQRQIGDEVERKRVLAVLIHGDAAFPGQGLVAETFNLSQLEGYRTGGTVHIIVNNQIGFTTDPRESRSTAYSSDVAKLIEAPIFHVNGDDPEAVVFVMELALKYRQTFGADVVVDMLCYRKYGHNEGDEPAFTQPLLYEVIKKHQPVRAIYIQKLLEEGVLTEVQQKAREEEFQATLQRNFEYARTPHPDMDVQAYEQLWNGLSRPYDEDEGHTAVDYVDLKFVANALTSIPQNFHINRKIARQLKARMEVVERKGSVDWAFAEILAMGTLLKEGTPVRLSGQDSERGTFSQRHSVWVDQKTLEKFHPLNHIARDQAHFCVYNSPLTEAAVLGFEYGYSLAEPRMMVLWEAQFGDFANGAQVIIDQFIVSSESKWQRTSGIVMLLPHGYEGQGPEHSNAYLERYLMAAAQNNIQVCNLSTPAQYFHVLRRQMKRLYRRPLIMMTPKSMLRNKRAVSPISDLTDEFFHEVLDDPREIRSPRRLLFVSGKLYHEIDEYREKLGIEDVAVVRVEQFYPIRHDLYEEICERYASVEEIVWVQEETKNRGGWSFMKPLLEHHFPEIPVHYIGRGFAASPATGSIQRHRYEQEEIIKRAMNGQKLAMDDPVLPEEIYKEQRKAGNTL